MFDLLFAKVPGTTFPYELEQYLQEAKQLKWYTVPIFVITVYIIVSELKKRNYSVVLGGLAFWLMDVFNETWNSMVTQHWSTRMGYNNGWRFGVTDTGWLQHRDFVYVLHSGYYRLQDAFDYRRV